MNLLYVYRGQEFHCKAWDSVHLLNILQRTYEHTEPLEPLTGEAVRIVADGEIFTGYRNFLGYQL